MRRRCWGGGDGGFIRGRDLQFSAARIIIAPAMLLERLQLKNYKMFRHVDLRDIPALAVFVGVNGSGKTTLFDTFDFLRDVLGQGIKFALRWRGGFRELRTRGEEGRIEMEFTFRAELGGVERPISYSLRIAQDKEKQPRIEREVLGYPVHVERSGVVNMLDFKDGRGTVVTNEAEVLNGGEAVRQEETVEPFIPAVMGIGQLGRYEAAGAVRRFVANWHLSQFVSDAARDPVAAGEHKHLLEHGGNLAGVIGFMQANHPKIYSGMLKKMSRRAPGFNDALVEEMTDGHLRLKFRDARWKEPFDARHMSDGTIKMLGLLALLEDPEPRSLLCVEEPENQLYPYLLDELMEDFRLYAQRGSGQVLASTHSYELMDAAKLEEVFWLVKQTDGTSVLHRAKNDETIRAMSQEEEVKMGELWRRGHLEGARP